MTKTVLLDPQACAAMGIEEEIAVVLPNDFGDFTPAQRTAWATREIETIALEMLATIGAAHGTPPSPAQEAAYLCAIRPGIEHLLGGEVAGE